MIDWSPVDRIFAAWDRPGSPGAALAVIEDGKVAYARGYGSANLEYDVPITGDTVFHVASVSKQFTAAAVLALAEDGKLGLDDDVRLHLPWVPAFGPRITVRQLIQHSSGMRDQWELLRWAGWRMDDVITQEHLLRIIRRQRELNFAPGSEHLYSNTGYTLLAEIVAAVSGQSFRDFTKQRFFDRLGMDSTFFFTDHEEIVPGRAYSYSPEANAPSGFKKSVLSYANAGATSLFTTANDLTRWLLHLDGIEGTALSRQMQDALVLTSGEIVPYAAGLSVAPYRGVRQVGHSGSDAGFRSYCGRFVGHGEHGLGVVILANLSTMEPARLAQSVADLRLGARLSPLPAPPATRAPSELGIDLGAYAGSYILTQVGMRVTVRAAADGLNIDAGGELNINALPVDAERFYAPALAETVVFEHAGGAVTGFRLPRFGRMMQVKRILDLPPSEATLAMEGDYYSSELDTTYRVRRLPRGLVVEHQRLPDTLLLPTGPGEFEGDRSGSGTFVFDLREGSLLARGFRLTGGRCRNLLFERVDD
jgi:CubicO group peptidase (beta-lactamase class C family)